jgi:ADP-ribosyl-[dinitrogen reductase] hydrolase
MLLKSVWIRLKMDEIKNRFRGCLLGLACGDALWAIVEFLPRGSFKLLKDIIGGGKFQLEPGKWTDDTSMALCLGSSLLESKGFDPNNQMDKYLKWANKGHLSCKDYFFGMGKTVFKALSRYKKTGDAYCGDSDPKTAGNGCIMRLAPIVLFFYPHFDSVIYYSGESSKTTHGAIKCIDACRLLGSILLEALSGKQKQEILLPNPYFLKDQNNLSENIKKIADGDYQYKEESEIRGSGYVVQSLEAALWCFHNTDTFKSSVLKAANLGEDSDTTAAICGQIAGAYYGVNGIPKDWVEKIAMKNFILNMSDELFKCTGQYK